VPVAHVWQVPEHAVLQQVWLPAGPTQLPCAHCVLTVHAWPSGTSAQMPALQNPLAQSVPVPHFWPVAQVLFWATQAPPQSLSVSLPSCMLSVHETQTAAAPDPKQSLFVQSPSTLQCFVSAHLGQVPPQSLSVSVPFCTVSVHVGGWQKSCCPPELELEE